MAQQHSESKFQALQDLTAAQVTAIVHRTRLSRDEVAKHLACGTSQLFKYEKEGLPPRMNRQVRAAILKLGLETQVLPANAAPPFLNSLNQISFSALKPSRIRKKPPIPEHSDARCGTSI